MLTQLNKSPTSCRPQDQAHKNINCLKLKIAILKIEIPKFLNKIQPMDCQQQQLNNNQQEMQQGHHQDINWFNKTNQHRHSRSPLQQKNPLIKITSKVRARSPQIQSNRFVEDQQNIRPGTSPVGQSTINEIQGQQAFTKQQITNNNIINQNNQQQIASTFQYESQKVQLNSLINKNNNDVFENNIINVNIARPNTSPTNQTNFSLSPKNININQQFYHTQPNFNASTNNNQFVSHIKIKRLHGQLYSPQPNRNDDNNQVRFGWTQSSWNKNVNQFATVNKDDDNISQFGDLSLENVPLHANEFLKQSETIRNFPKLKVIPYLPKFIQVRKTKSKPRSAEPRGRRTLAKRPATANNQINNQLFLNLQDQQIQKAENGESKNINNQPLQPPPILQMITKSNNTNQNGNKDISDQFESSLEEIKESVGEEKNSQSHQSESKSNNSNQSSHIISQQQQQSIEQIDFNKNNSRKQHKKRKKEKNKPKQPITNQTEQSNIVTPNQFTNNEGKIKENNPSLPITLIKIEASNKASNNKTGLELKQKNNQQPQLLTQSGVMIQQQLMNRRSFQNITRNATQQNPAKKRKSKQVTNVRGSSNNQKADDLIVQNDEQLIGFLKKYAFSPIERYDQSNSSQSDAEDEEEGEQGMGQKQLAISVSGSANKSSLSESQENTKNEQEEQKPSRKVSNNNNLPSSKHSLLMSALEVNTRKMSKMLDLRQMTNLLEQMRKIYEQNNLISEKQYIENLPIQAQNSNHLGPHKSIQSLISKNNIMRRVSKFHFASNLEIEQQLLIEQQCLDHHQVKNEPFFDDVKANAVLSEGFHLNKEIWDQELQDFDPETLELVQHCQKSKREFDARVPVFINNKYQWQKVKVLSFDLSTLKFTVQLVDQQQKNGNQSSQSTKTVGRLALIFRDEDPKILMQRIHFAQQKTSFLKDQKRYNEYVNQINSEKYIATSFFNSVKQSILDKVFTLGKSPLDFSATLVQQLCSEAEKNYITAMKELFVLKQMEDEQNQKFFRDKEIELRFFVQTVYPRFGGTMSGSELLTRISREVLESKSLVMQQSSQSCLFEISRKGQVILEQQLVMDTQLNRVQLPLRLEQLVEHQQNHIGKAQRLFVSYYREVVINDIITKLKHQFNEVIVREEEYSNSELRRFIKRVHMQLATFLQENVFEEACRMWLQFIQNFTLPSYTIKKSQEDQNINKNQATEVQKQQQRFSQINNHDKLQKNLNSENMWIINQKSLIHIHLVAKTPQLKLDKVNQSNGEIMNAEQTDKKLKQQQYNENQQIDSKANLDQVGKVDEQLEGQVESDEKPSLDNNSEESQGEEDAIEQEKQSGLNLQEVILNQIGANQAGMQGTIVVEPGRQEIVDSLFQPINCLIEAVNQFESFESSIIPCLPKNCKPEPVFFLDRQSESVQSKLYYLQRQIDYAYNLFVQPILNRYLKYKSLLSVKLDSFAHQLFAIELDQSPLQITNEKLKVEGTVHASRHTSPEMETTHSISSQKLKHSNAELFAVNEEKIKYYLQKYSKLAFTVQGLTCDEINLPLFRLHTKQCKQDLIHHAENLRQGILQRLLSVVRHAIHRLNNHYSNTYNKLKQTPKTEEDMIQIKKLSNTVESQMNTFDRELGKVQRLVMILEDNYFQIQPEEVYENYWLLHTWPRKMREVLIEVRHGIELREKKFVDALMKEKEELGKRINEINEQFQSLKQFSSYGLAKEYNLHIQNFNEGIREAVTQITQFNRRETLLEIKTSEFPLLNEILEQSKSYTKFWELAFEFQNDLYEWMVGPLLKMSHQSIEKKIEAYLQQLLNIQQVHNILSAQQMQLQTQQSQFPVNIENQALSYQQQQQEQQQLQHQFQKQQSQGLLNNFYQGQGGSAHSPPSLTSIGMACNQMRQELEAVKDKLWMVEYLTVEAMVKRPQQYFKDLFKECQVQITLHANDEMSWQQLIEVGMLTMREQIENHSKLAEKEWNIEKKLNETQDKFKELHLEVLKYRQTGSAVLRNAEDLQDALSEQLTLVLMLKSSQYVRPVQRRVNELEQRIASAQDAIDEWLKTQHAWVYLEAIFTGNDIRQKLPQESAQFREIDTLWRTNIAALSIRESSSLWNIDTERIRSEFETANKTLSHIQKKLSEYLETKRIAFPRLHFMSDQDLLDLLSRSRDPENLQRHLNKCFEAISALELQFTVEEDINRRSGGAVEGNVGRKAEGETVSLHSAHSGKSNNTSQSHDQQQQCQLTAMISGEHEKVKFFKPISLGQDPAVEKWLLEIEINMKRTLRHQFRLSLQERQLQLFPSKLPSNQMSSQQSIKLGNKSQNQNQNQSAAHMNSNDNTLERFQQWIFSWPSQIVQTVEQVCKVQLIESAIINGTLSEQEQASSTTLNFIVDLIRQDLSDMQRICLSSMIIHGVHTRDCVTAMIQDHVSSQQHFIWQAHPRYYITWQAPIATNSQTASNSDTYQQEDNDLMQVFGNDVDTNLYAEDTHFSNIVNGIKLKMLTNCVRYGFEYLGSTSRLVITPLTDRCFHTLFCAYKLQYGGAPEGPAGTGKTETVKDLAKACGMHCVVFNASDGLNAQTMYKFFKGLAGSGSWCCFDEFNRIDTEVLSVVALLIMNIQQAIRQRKISFSFEGEHDIRLVLTCTVNITMNPGYQGRSELPDNLKALFRPCAMMIADYNMIAENYLYSLGFHNSRSLSRKIVAALTLASQQLSSQDHYDFGMRSLKAVLFAISQMKIKTMNIQFRNKESRVFSSETDQNQLQQSQSKQDQLTQSQSGVQSSHMQMQQPQPQYQSSMQSPPLQTQEKTLIQQETQIHAETSPTFKQQPNKGINEDCQQKVNINDDNNNQTTFFNSMPEDEIAMQAIIGVNLPKFTDSDRILFLSILSDLFPGLKPPNQRDEQLYQQIKQVCTKQKVIAANGFIDKSIQLFETMAIRHGVIVVGSASSGKSSIIEVMRQTVTELSQRTPDNNNIINSEKQNKIYRKVHAQKINPKSITSSMLYGAYDENTKLWVDGVLAISMRNYLEKADQADFSWIIFDGPVDAVWIENINTVLDDNKKLCLNSGEIIKLTPYMLTLFECDDLSHASPATISRCGMVFLGSELIDWQDILQSFFLAEELKELFRERPALSGGLLALMKALVGSALAFLSECDLIAHGDKLADFLVDNGSGFRSGCVFASKNILAKNYVNLLSSLFLEQLHKIDQDLQMRYQETVTFNIKTKNSLQTGLVTTTLQNVSAKHSTVIGIDKRGSKNNPNKQLYQQRRQQTAEDIFANQQINTIKNFALFAAVWAFSGQLDESGRKSFSLHMFELISANPSNISQGFQQMYQKRQSSYQHIFNDSKINSNKDDWMSIIFQTNPESTEEEQQLFKQILNFTDICNFFKLEGSASNQAMHDFVLKGNSVGLLQTWIPKSIKTQMKNTSTIQIEDGGQYQGSAGSPSKSKTSQFNFLITSQQQQSQIEYTNQQQQLLFKSSTIIVRTEESDLIEYFVTLLTKQGRHFLVVGPTGTGKSVIVVNTMMQQFNDEKGTFLLQNFSGSTKAANLQHQIEGKMTTKYRKGVFRPEEGRSQLVVFLDDVNLSTREPYGGAQPPIELLRQWIDTGSWYDLETKESKRMEGMVLVAAMMPRNLPSLRFLRRFFPFYAAPYQVDSLLHIFNTRLVDHFSQGNLHLGIQKQGSSGSIEFTQEVLDTQANIMKSTILLYNKIKDSPEFLPSPKKPHYLINIRDISRVCQGLQLATPYNVLTSNQFLKLWRHECMRIFYDRLTDQRDQKQFENILTEVLQTSYQKIMKQQEGDNKAQKDSRQASPLLFASFLQESSRDYELGTGSNRVIGNGGGINEKQTNLILEAGQKIYREVRDMDELQESVSEYIHLYNQGTSQNKFHLVLFTDALIHVVKIVRIISFNQGHALLLGSGGSGRRTLTALATFIAGMKLFQIKQGQDWKEQVKSVMHTVTVEGQKSVIYVVETQTHNDTIMEDISHLLNNGEVPDLLTKDEKSKMLEEMDSKENLNKYYFGGSSLNSRQGTQRAIIKPEEKENNTNNNEEKNQGTAGNYNSTRASNLNIRYEHFKKICRNNLHIVLAMSSASNSFRQKIRNYPSIVNCTTIDWFFEWTEEAYITTAEFILQEHGEIVDITNKQEVSRVLVKTQQQIARIAQAILTEQNRHIHFTPMIFVQCVEQVNKLITKFEQRYSEQISRYTSGQHNIVNAEQDIQKLRENLSFMQEQLNQLTEENTLQLADLEVKHQEADQKKTLCEHEEEETNAAKTDADKLQAECKQELDRVLPLLQEAQDALSKISKDDLTTLRSYTSPPDSVRIVMEALCYIFQVDHLVQWRQVVIDPLTVQAQSSKTNKPNKQVQKSLNNQHQTNQEVQQDQQLQLQTLDKLAQLPDDTGNIQDPIKNQGNSLPYIEVISTNTANQTSPKVGGAGGGDANGQPVQAQLQLNQGKATIQALQPTKVGLQLPTITKVQDFWDYAKKHILNEKLIKQVKQLKMNQISQIAEDKIRKLKKIIEDPLFEKEKVFISSVPAGNLSLWIRAVKETYEALKIVNPKKVQLEKAKEQFKQASLLLVEKKKALQDALDQLSILTEQYNLAKNQRDELQKKVDLCKQRIIRSEQLIHGLEKEKIAWTHKAEECQANTQIILADSILCSTALTYFGVLPQHYRINTFKYIAKQLHDSDIQVVAPPIYHQTLTSINNLEEVNESGESQSNNNESSQEQKESYSQDSQQQQESVQKLRSDNSYSKNKEQRKSFQQQQNINGKNNDWLESFDYKLPEKLSDPIIIETWVGQQRLPNDRHSIENAVIMKNSEKWPLCIDPQGQANIFIKEMEKENRLLVLNPYMSQTQIFRLLENALQIGVPLLLEDFGEIVQPSILEPIVFKQFTKQGASYRVVLGLGVGNNNIADKGASQSSQLGSGNGVSGGSSNIVEVSSDFRMYITCKASNPQHAPDISGHCLLLNFTVTEEGLEDQMLNVVVRIEEPQKDQQHLQNIKELFTNRQNMIQIEMKILDLISHAKGDDLIAKEDLLLTLKNSKSETELIQSRIKQLSSDQTIFNEIRDFYRKVAKLAAMIFFVFMDLPIIEYTYQFSLEWFTSFFERAILLAQHQSDKSQRCSKINSNFLLLLFQNAQRALKDSDKLLLSFVLCSKILLLNNQLTQLELRYFTMTTVYTETDNLNPMPSWLSERQWASIVELCQTIPAFRQNEFLQEFSNLYLQEFYNIFQSKYIQCLIDVQPQPQKDQHSALINNSKPEQNNLNIPKQSNMTANLEAQDLSNVQDTEVVRDEEKNTQTSTSHTTSATITDQGIKKQPLLKLKILQIQQKQHNQRQMFLENIKLASQSIILPGKWSEKLTQFQRLMLIKILRPEKVIQSVRRLISKELGSEFINFSPFDLQMSFDDSKCQTPIFFILTPGVDPTQQISQFADQFFLQQVSQQPLQQHLISKQKLKIIPLGQGQREKAELAINKGIYQGDWILLQNCHLSPSFMPILEILLNQFSTYTVVSSTVAQSDGQSGGASHNKNSQNSKQNNVKTNSTNNHNTSKPNSSQVNSNLNSSQVNSSTLINQQVMHKNFRLWLTSYSSQTVPVSVLQRSIKLRAEHPKGLRNIVRRLYGVLDMEPTLRQIHEKYPRFFQRCFFAIIFFHAIIQERSKFGPVGWNKVYEFTFSDLSLSLFQLGQILDRNQRKLQIEDQPQSAIQWNILTYLIGEINYGGRVTDSHDRSLLRSILCQFVDSKMFSKNYISEQCCDYFPPANSDSHQFWRDHYKTFEKYPSVDQNQIFGLHDNAEIAGDLFWTTKLLNQVLSLLPRRIQEQNYSNNSNDNIQQDDDSQLQKALQQKQEKVKSNDQQLKGSSSQKINGQSIEIVVKERSTLFLSIIKVSFNEQEIQQKIPIKYQESLNTVIQQEVKRYSKLVNLVRSNLKNVISAIEGTNIMSSDLEIIQNNIFDNLVPQSWIKSSYPSLKPLASWINDLKERLQYIQDFISNGIPKVFWLGGFFYTQAFLTGILQNFSRQQQIPIDQLNYDFVVIPDQDKQKYQIGIDHPPYGCYIHRLFIECAQWNQQLNIIQDPQPGQLNAQMPTIWFKPIKNDQQPINKLIYKCPLYKTSQRQGELSTTGISTNWIIDVALPILKSQNQELEIWALRGVALLLQLDY